MSIELPPEQLSKEAYQKLEEELKFLAKTKRGEISSKLEESSSLGDISENAEYQEAKEEQLMNENRIAELEDILSRAVIFSKTTKTNVEIEIGSSVVLKKTTSEEVFDYFLVGSGESNPTERKISTESPLGKSLIGCKKGSKVEVLTPSGKISYTIVEIS
ncbi:transcription elongation factor GreA [Patescibacteria group bacterium]